MITKIIACIFLVMLIPSYLFITFMLVISSLAYGEPINIIGSIILIVTPISIMLLNNKKDDKSYN